MVFRTMKNVINGSKNKNIVSFTESPLNSELVVVLQRKQIKYENHSKKFLCANKEFKRQFCHIYASRLNELKSTLTKSCIAKWGNSVYLHFFSYKQSYVDWYFLSVYT